MEAGGGTYDTREAFPEVGIVGLQTIPRLQDSGSRFQKRFSF